MMRMVVLLLAIPIMINAQSLSGVIQQEKNNSIIVLLSGSSGANVARYINQKWHNFKPPGSPIYETYKTIGAYGSKVITAYSDDIGRLYSFDGGSWVEERPNGDFDYDWRDVAIYNNKMAAIEGGVLWIYNDTSWVNHNPSGSVIPNYSFVDIYKEKILTAELGGRVYLYDGSNWDELQPSGDVSALWYRGAIYGNNIVLSIYPFGVSLSDIYFYDSNTWTKINPPDSTNIVWDLDLFKNRIIACGSGYVYFNDGQKWERQLSSVSGAHWWGSAIFEGQIIVCKSAEDTPNEGVFWYKNNRWVNITPGDYWFIDVEIDRKR